MRSAIAATLAVAAALVAVNMLGVAAAEAPTTTPLRSVSVEGVASMPIAQEANRASATSVYREGMAAAMADAQNKAEFLTGKAGGTLGAVQSIVEGGGYINCTSDEESVYDEYRGEQPDFGSPGGSVSPIEAAAAPSVRSTVSKPTLKRRKKKHPTAKKASAPTCMLSAQVTLVYAID
jgi:hypothetical protein